MPNRIGPGGPRPGSLRLRLTLWYTGVLAVILAGAALLVYAGAHHALGVETDGFLASEAHRIAAVAAGRPGDPADAGDIAEAVTASSTAPGPADSGHNSGLLFFDNVYVRLAQSSPTGAPVLSPSLTRQPALVASLDSLLRPPLPAAGQYAFAGPDEERLMRVYTLPLRAGSTDRLLQVAVPWDHNADILERLGRLLLLGVPLVLLLAALGGWTLVGRTLQPISRIVAEAERLDAAALPEALLPQAAETDSEIGHLVGTLNRMTTRLRRAFDAQHQFADAQQRFAADASHELRTPLTILRGEIELALSRPRAPEQYQQTLQSAMHEVARMTRIVEGLSFLARRDAGQLQATPIRADIDLAALSTQVVDEFAAQAERRRVSLRCDPKRPAPLVVRADPDQLQQLLRNLIDNALKYTPTGGQVTVAVAVDSSAAFLSVRDTGIGIAESDMPRVFDRFWRADQSRATGGSGLGLAICAEIAAAHGGTLRVTSEPGQGSTFLLRLPIQLCDGGV